MDVARLSDLELGEGYYENDETVRWRDNLPLTPGTPGTSDVVARDLVVVYFEVDPGKRLGTHTDSEEEVLLALEGRAAVAVDDDEGELAAGEMTVVPPEAPHAVRNVGDDTAALLGFFPEGEVHHVFDEPVMPYGTREFVSQFDPEPSE